MTKTGCNGNNPHARTADLEAGFPFPGEPARLFAGTAGWAIPARLAARFPGPGSHLERYGARLGAVEINSSFYRHHLPKTYARWAAATPSGFRFAVKLARAFTHDARLAPPGEAVRASLAAIAELKEKFAVLLVQLPPSLAFEAGRAHRFLSFLRDYCPARVAWEPRHPSWAGEEALALLETHGAARVLADPDPCPAGRLLSSDRALRYYRLHGSPEIYRSNYRPPFLRRLAASIEAAPSASVWCVFDNTTFGYALENALELRSLLGGRARERIVS
jgi:uncharacterized protein YecE (DUF72 family)